MAETQWDASNSMTEGGEYQQFVEIKPWTRFWSRILDYIIFVSLTFFLLENLFKISLSGLQAFLIYFLTVLIWTFIEAVAISTWGSTPGKWLFNVTIQDSAGKKPSFKSALSRSILVWFLGIGMGIPVVCFWGLGVQYNYLLKAKATSWDSKQKLTIKHDYLRGIKTTIAVLIYAGFVIIQLIIPQMKLGIAESEKVLKQYGIFEPAAANNRRGYSFMNQGEYEKAKEEFLKGLNANPDMDLRDTLLNNLSWACYSLDEYEEALKYSEDGLALSENDSAEHSNYGNALYALGDESEAVDAYKKSIELDKSNSYAYYGLGQIKYENDEYAEAIEAFVKYTGLEQDDPEGWCYLGLAHLYENKNLQKAKECLDKAEEISPKSLFVIESMALYYNYIDEPQKVKEIYTKALEDNENDYDLICKVAEFYQNEEKYDEAIQYADRAILADAMSYEAYRIKAQTFYWQGEKQSAIDVVNLMIGKIKALYYSKHYTACLEFAMEAEKEFDNYEIPWYMADVYSRLGDSLMALVYYKIALSKDETEISLITSIGWEYFYIEDFTNAAIYVEKALLLDDTYYNAKELKKSIEKRQTSVVDQVADFIEKNYMYYKPNAEYDAVKKSLKAKPTSDIEDTNKLFNAVHKKEDLFSFVLSGTEYKRFLGYQYGTTVEHKSMNENTEYIRISSFSWTTANEFLDTIDSIKDTVSKYLIIDLRGNGGGDTTSGSDVLDFLLPDSVVCNLIYKDGYSNAYYSDEDHIKFKHIFVLTDEQSASCSELLSLGLKTYLDNVSIIGRTTFGKGVGQIIFEDKTRGFVIFIVNHYWNVREENISDKGIQPDKVVKGNTLESYMSEVNKLIDSMQ